MVDSARVYAMEKGIDLTKFTMVVLGGAGPVHAYEIALKLKLSKIVYPPRAGVLSALGFLVAPASFELSRSYLTILEKLDLDLANRIYQEMEAEGLRLIQQVGVAPPEITFTRTVAARYLGQGYDIEIPVSGGRLTSQHLTEIRENFNAEYKRTYNRLNEGIDIELIDWRVVVSGPKPSLNLSGNLSGDVQTDKALKGSRKAYFPDFRDYVQVPVYDRYGLRAGQKFKGPAVVEEKESTVVIGPKGRVEVDLLGNIIVTIEG